MMGWFGKGSRPQSRIDSLVGVGTRVEGDLTFSGGLRVDGEVVGNVREVGDKPSTLVLSERARIHGAIEVSHVVVNGTVLGPVSAAEYVELQSKARVTGDVVYKRLEMHLGAVVEGKMIPREDAITAGAVAEAPTA